MDKIFNEYIKSYSLNEQNAKEFFDIVKDIYDTEQFRSMGNYIQHADITRLQHIMSVAYISYVITKEKNLDYVSASRAAMLHDLFYYDWHVKGDGTHRLHGYRHPAFALKNAKELFELSPLEENIILRHMWPLTITPPKYKESFAVSMADKYCATQEILIKNISAYNHKFRWALKKGC